MKCDNLEHLRSEVKKVLSRKSNRTYDTEKGEITLLNDVLYRGHGDSNWDIESTWHRKNPGAYSVQSYMELCLKIRSVIESVEQLPFEKITYLDVENYITTTATNYGPINIPGYEFLIYLRHHGFPSPFLDWTRSFYVALAFAFYEDCSPEFRSIYLYIERPSGAKMGPGGLHVCGPYAAIHRRHYMQQSNYTIAYTGKGKDMEFVSHKDLFQNEENPNPVLEQDLLYKFELPNTCRQEILEELMSMNITPYTLYGSIDALVKTLYLTEREIIMSKLNKLNPDLTT